MGLENVKLFFGKNDKNEIVEIWNVNDKNKNDNYYCPICMSKIIPRLGSVVTRHFAHIDKSKCTPESFVHFWIKNKLLVEGDSFKIKLTENKILKFKCKKLLIEKSYKTKFGIYKPDITIITDNDEIIYFEIAHTNKKRIDEYIDRWKYLNKPVVEVSTKDLIHGNVTKEFNGLYYDGNIYNFEFKEYKNNNEIKLYKNNIIQNFEIKIAEEKLKKIDWFWQECIKRKMNLITDEYFFDVIDYLEIDDRQFVIDKVLKTNCTDLRWLYLYYKQKQIKDYSKNFSNENNLNLKIECGKELIERNIFNKKFQIPYVYIKDCFDNNLLKIYCDYIDLDKIKLLLNNYEYIYNGKFKNRINKINNILNETLPNYNLTYTIINNTEAEIYINYNVSTITSFKIIDLINDDIIKIATHLIYENKKDIKSTGLENTIKDYIITKNKLVNKLNKIDNLSLSLEVIYFREDEIIIYLKKSIFNELQYLFLIKGNEIRSSERITKFNNIYEFKEQFDELLSYKIRKIRYNL